MKYIYLFLFIFQGCNLEKIDEELNDGRFFAKTTKSSFWGFNSAANYTYDTNYISVTAGAATNITVDQVYDSSTDFARGTHEGTIYSGGSLTLDVAASAGLVSSWAPQYNNLVAYWSLDNDWEDVVGLNDGTAFGDAAFTTTAKVGSHAGTFDGTGDYVTFAQSTILEPDSFTLNVWANVDSAVITDGNAEIVFDYGQLAVSGYGIYLLGTGFWASYLATDNGGSGITATSMATGDWQMLTLIYNDVSKKLTFYIDGQKDTEVAADVDVPTALASWAPTIGDCAKSCTNREFNGSIDDVAFWNVALTDGEVNTIYNRQANKYGGTFTSDIIDLGVSAAWSSIAWTTNVPIGKELPPASANELVTDYSEVVDATGTVGNSALGTNLVALWHLNEASWSGVAGEILDSSGNGHHGQSFNSVTTVTNGLFYGAGDFDGVDDYALMPASVSSTIGNNITAAGWVYLDSVGGAGDVDIIVGEAYTGDLNVEFQIGLGAGGGAPDRWGVAFFSGGWQLLTDVSLASTGKWTHVAGTYDGDRLRLYVDGVLVNTGASLATALPSGSNGWRIGRRHDAGDYIDGRLDEIAIWSRTLNDEEIKQLYLRGVHKLDIQVRSCDDSACSGETWTGAANNDISFFNELHNCSSINLATGVCNGTVNATPPSMSFSNFPAIVNNNRYFQYRVQMSTIENALCSGASTCLPKVNTVTVGPTGRFYGSGTIRNATPMPFANLTSFSADDNGICNITYQLSLNNITFYYWNGFAWVLAANESQSNSESVINSVISLFPGQVGAGNLYWKAILNSDSSQNCLLNFIKVTE